jgi:hypothetical protein
VSPHRGPRRALAAGLALTALVLALAGCDADEPSRGSAESAPSTTIAATGKAEPIPQGAGKAPAPLPELATATGSQPGTQVTVHELRRSDDDTVRLVFTVSNRSSRRWTYLARFNEPGLAPGGAATDVGGTYLIDQANNMRHLVLRDTGNACVCSEGIPGSLDDGEQFTAFAEFPAPPASVRSVTVVIPLFTPMQDVPIST